MEKVKVFTATFVTLLGCGLCYIDYFINGSIQESSLGYLGESLLWSGSIFGCKLYIDYKLKAKEHDVI